jgi:predicted acylesterase/phospholipase RssA
LLHLLLGDEMGSSHRTALVFTPRKQCAEDLFDILAGQPWIRTEASEQARVFRGKGLTLHMEPVFSVDAAIAYLAHTYCNLVVVDCRHMPHCNASPARQEERVFAFLEALRREHDRERRYPFRRIVVLVGDPDEARADRLVFAMGEKHVGACLRDASMSARFGGERPAAELAHFAESFWALCTELMVERQRGRKAINLAGGGISGIYYELGVLKCLDDALDVDVRDFDFYSGISAGALVAAGLANRYSVDDLLHKLGRIDRTWRSRLQLGLRHLNVGELPKRALLVQRELRRYVVRMVKGEDELSVTSLLGAWGVALGPLFDSTEFESAMRRLLTGPGRTNDFRELERQLFIGATDQDRREHVLFGAEGYDHVPISRAIQASAAMHPFFPSVEIDGRYYTDGIVTRTSNLRNAIDRGADLVFVVDPFVPLISDDPGFNASHGNMWIMEQDYKTMSYTRYEQARNEIIRRYPRVSVYTFVPSNRMRRLMSAQSPFVSRNFHAIVCEAYRSTFRRLGRVEYKIAGELHSHGITLDLGPVEEKCRRLAGARDPDVRLLLGRASEKAGAA